MGRKGERRGELAYKHNPPETILIMEDPLSRAFRFEPLPTNHNFIANKVGPFNALTLFFKSHSQDVKCDTIQ